MSRGVLSRLAIELQVLELLWSQGPSTVRELRTLMEARGRTWAHTTVRTMVHRLRDKGVERPPAHPRRSARVTVDLFDLVGQAVGHAIASFGDADDRPMDGAVYSRPGRLRGVLAGA